MGTLDAEIKSIVNEYHWSPDIIDKLYLDDFDHHGIMFWFENLQELHSKIPKKTT